MWSMIGTWEFSKESVAKGAELLQENVSALDAVITAVTMVEDNEAVDSVGCGGFPNVEGEVELDAAIMLGSTLESGSVAAVKGFKNPILLAKDVLLETKHSILVGEGAMKFAQERQHRQGNLLTEQSYQKWLELKGKLEKEKTEQEKLENEKMDQDKLKESKKAQANNEVIGHDTVGIIALATDGQMCVGTSTSGAGMKLAGRVGDSPLVGSGFYVDNACGGAAATGWGEDIMKVCTSFYATELLRQGFHPQKAAEQAVLRTHNAIIRAGKNPGNIAVICADNQGNTGGAANHEGFSYASASEGTAVRLIQVEPIVLRESSNTKLELINNIQKEK